MSCCRGHFQAPYAIPLGGGGRDVMWAGGAQSTVLPHSELPNSRNVKKRRTRGDLFDLSHSGGLPNRISENTSETYLLFASPHQEGTPSRGHSFLLACVRIFSKKE